MFKRRLGLDPHANGNMTGGAKGCPDIWELEDGSFAVIGARMTDELEPLLPATASRGHDEEIVVIPRITLIRARMDIPNE